MTIMVTITTKTYDNRYVSCTTRLGSAELLKMVHGQIVKVMWYSFSDLKAYSLPYRVESPKSFYFTQLPDSLILNQGLQLSTSFLCYQAAFKVLSVT